MNRTGYLLNPRKSVSIRGFNLVLVRGFQFKWCDSSHPTIWIPAGVYPAPGCGAGMTIITLFLVISVASVAEKTVLISEICV